MFKRKGGGVKGVLNNVKKTALFLKDGFPNLYHYSSFLHSFICLSIYVLHICVFVFTSVCSPDQLEHLKA